MKTLVTSILLAIGLAVVVSLITDSLLAAEWKTQTKTLNAGEVFILPELGSVILSKDDALVVDLSGHPEKLPKVYRDVDLREGDKIIMLNGSRVKTIKELENGYAVITPNETVKIGISRDGQMMMVSFPKGDPDKLPVRRMIVANQGEGGEVSVLGGGSDKMLELDASDAAVIADAGLIVALIEEKLTISSILPNANEIKGLEDVQVGDVVDKVNGVHFLTTQDLADFWNEIKVGEEVSLTLLRDGASHTAKFQKQEVQNEMPMIIRSKAKND